MTEAKVLRSGEAGDTGRATTLREEWRTRALFARLNDSILGGIVIVAWPSS